MDRCSCSDPRDTQLLSNSTKVMLNVNNNNCTLFCVVVAHPVSVTVLVRDDSEFGILRGIKARHVVVVLVGVWNMGV